MACGNDGQFARLTAELEVPALAADPRFATNADRVAHRSELIPLLEAALAADATANWHRRLRGVGVPAGKVGGIDDGIAYARELGLDPVIEVHDASGAVVGRQLRHPISWTPALDAPTKAPPQLGQHTEAVRTWLADG